MPRQNLQKKSDDRIVKDSKKLNIIIRRKYVLSLSRENEFSSSMTSWNLNLWSYSTDCWKNFWSMKFKLTSVWLSFYQNELPIKKSFYQKNKKKKKKKKTKIALKTTFLDFEKNEDVHETRCWPSSYETSLKDALT